MSIDYCLYELDAYTVLQTRARGICRRGALLKIAFEQQRVGYADCHPWPELGDLPLQEQLNGLKNDRFTPLTRCSWAWARLDAQARERGESLLGSLSAPLSHYLVPNILSWSSREVQAIEQQGYTHLKLKMGRSPEREARHLMDLFENTSLQLRLDFNEALSYSSFQSFLDHIEALKAQIDFIEDPFPFQAQQWEAIQMAGWSLACDRHVLQAHHLPNCARVLVFKPAIQPEAEWKRETQQRRVITSYLGHPLDQVAAAYAAAHVDMQRRDVHGLLSHHVYPSNPFSQQLASKGPRFIAPLGKGSGFERELAQLEWRRLK